MAKILNVCTRTVYEELKCIINLLKTYELPDNIDSKTKILIGEKTDENKDKRLEYSNSRR